jgi:tRNA threonylcarbamoyladenosine modification (KEOPS) complex  Pcc1 subunit
MTKRSVLWTLARAFAAGVALGVLAGCPNPSGSPGNDASLKSLTISAGSLAPDFASGTEGYAVTVGFDVSSVTVTAEPNHPNATMDNPASGGQTLAVGGNAITITVTAEDGKTTKTYTITVTRQAEEPSNDATLKTLTLSAGVLSPAFAPGTTDYAAAVEHSVSSITVTAVSNHANATVNNPAASGLALNPGSNAIAITVTAEDGTTVATYAITVTRPYDASLASLALDHGNLQPAFAPDTLSYTASVLYTVNAITATAAAAQSGATVDNSAAAGQALSVGGNNTITIAVTAADGTTAKTYTITVTRQDENYQPSNDAALKSLTLSAGVLAPAFAAGTMAYTSTVEFGVSSITVTEEQNDPHATVDNPAAAGKALELGGNTITITVTAEDEETTKTYVITVTRREPSNDATLKALSLGGGIALVPAFAPGTTAYAVSVEHSISSITVTAEPNHANATVDNPASEGKSLDVGGNTITITVTAEDGTTTKAYTITATRQAEVYQPSNNATLKTLTLSSGDLTPAFVSGTAEYSASVTVSSITVTAEPSHANATVNNPAAEGKALELGSNAIAITVTAEDGTTKKTYTVTVTREQLLPLAAPVITVKEGSTKLTVEWDPAPRATAYEVWYAPSFPGVDQTLQRSGGDISGTSHVITGLSSYTTSIGPRDDYKVLVYAKNADGRSATAGEWAGDLLEADRLLVQGINSNGTVQFDTNMVGDYRVIYVNDKDDLNTAREATTTPAAETDNVIVTGLTNGVTWYFWIQARTNAGGESDWSDSVSYTPHIPTPVISQLIPADASIEVYWGPVTSADSQEVSYEVWYYESASGSAPGTKANETDLPSSPYVITGLANDMEYTVYVTAKTQYDAMNSATKTATPRPLPARPAAPTLTPGIGQIGVSWTGSDDTSVTAFGVWYHTADDFSQAVKYAEVPGTSVTIKGLAHNTTYHVWLRAKNAAGFGPYSASASATTLASGAITVGFDNGLITVTDGNSDVSGGFALPASGSVTLSAAGGSFDAVNWYVDGSLVAGNPITLNGASYNDRRDHSVTFAGTKGGILYSSDPIPFRVTP